MHSTKLRRSVAVSALAIAGALGAFAMGARAGAALEGKTNQMTVARIPMPVLQAAIANAK
jgi:hypothetical protein